MGVHQNIDNVLYGDQNFMIPLHMDYGKFLIDRLLKAKEKIALIDGVTGEQITFGELVQLAVNTAGCLMRLGVKRNEVVAVCSENRMEFLITAIAVWCSGATATFLNSAYSKEEMIHTMNISKPKYVFFSPDTYKKYFETMLRTGLVDKFFVFGNTVNDKKVTNFNDIIKTRVDIGSFRPVTDDNGLAKTALILYSSGTTGLPKGAKLTHLNLIIAGNKTPDALTIGLRTLTIAPFSNAMGILHTMLDLINEKTVIYLTKFNEEHYLSCIKKYKVGTLAVVPPLVVVMSKSSIVENYDVSSVRVLYCGGAPLDIAVMNEIKKRFANMHVHQGYGMTEATGVVTEETMTNFKPGSVGQVVRGIICKIADIETGKALGPHQEGEVRIKGLLLFGGYIGKDISEELDEEGFFKTGDICYYDEDGFFFFVDRIKELIKYKAGQVAPAELEGILLQHPALKDVGVVGKPDTMVGELPTAFVVKKPGVDVTPKELIDFVAAKVSSWKQLRGGVYFIDEIPKVASGKILRRVLRDYLKNTKSQL